MKQFSIFESLDLVHTEIEELEVKAKTFDNRARLGQLKQCRESLNDCIFEGKYFDNEEDYSAQ